MSERIATLSGIVSRFLMRFASAGLIAMTVIITWQVFARYVLNQSPPWSEQAALLVMNWMVMSAAAAGVREKFHIRVGFAADNAPLRYRLPVHLGAHIIVGLVGLTFFIWGGELVLRTWAHSIPTLGLPRGVAYLPFPIAGFLIALFSAEHIAAEWRARGETR